MSMLAREVKNVGRRWQVGEKGFHRFDGSLGPSDLVLDVRNQLRQALDFFAELPWGKGGGLGVLGYWGIRRCGVPALGRPSPNPSRSGRGIWPALLPRAVLRVGAVELDRAGLANVQRVVRDL